MNAFANFVNENHTAVSLAVLHFSHLAWPKVKAAANTAFPWLAAHGGVTGVCLVAWRGMPLRFSPAAPAPSVAQASEPASPSMSAIASAKAENPS